MATNVNDCCMVPFYRKNRLFPWSLGVVILFGLCAIWGLMSLQRQVVQAADEQILLVSSLKSDAVLIYDGTTGAWLGEIGAPAANQPVQPTGLAVGLDGNYYIASSGTHQILRAKADSWQFEDLFVAAGSGGLVAPKGIAFDKNGLLYVSSATDQILRYNADGTFKDVFVDGLGKEGGGLDDPYGLAFGPDERLYVVDRVNSGVLRYDGITGHYIDTFTTGAPLIEPTDIKFGPTGNIFVTNSGGSSLLIFNGNNGQLLDTIGTGDLHAPTGIAFREKTLYVANQTQHNVVRYDGSAMNWPQFVAAGAGGLDGPMYMLFTENKTLPPATATPTPTATVTPVPGTACAPVRISDLPTTWMVNSTVDNDTTNLTLRCALTYANRGDIIHFDPAVFPPAAPATILLTAGLPTITQGSITLDGSAAGVILDGRNLPAGISGLLLHSDGNRVANLQIVEMPRHGVEIEGNDNVIGTVPLQIGVVIPDISGPPALPGNLISGNGGAGVWIKGHRNELMANYIGTTHNGMAAWPNGTGVLVSHGMSNRIGTGADNYGNLISGNREVGVEIQGDFTLENQVIGNYIGTTVAGTAALPNGDDGVLLHSAAHQNQIGSQHSGSGNLISGNGGTAIRAESVLSLTVEANYIGTDIAGGAALANGSYGILLRDSGQSTIGRARSETGNHCDGGCNLIAGNTQAGVVLTGAQSQSNRVQANFIGTDVTGTKALPNRSSGLWLESGAHHNTIGGSGATQGNLISGNESHGVLLRGAGTDANQFFGNTIGMDLAQLQPLGNATGIRIEQNAKKNVVGEEAVGAANVIAGNRSHGVHLHGSETRENQILRNFIGTTATGLVYIGGNGGNGVLIEAGAHTNQIGMSSTPYAGNVIAFSRGSGIVINGAAQNRVWGNRIGELAGGSSGGNLENGLLLQNNARMNYISGNRIGYNGTNGLLLESGANTNEIGISGASLSNVNVIVANVGHGVMISGAGSNQNVIENNFIGSDEAGTAGLGNGGMGIYLHDRVQATNIFNNRIVNSNQAAIGLNGAYDNRVQGNQIGVMVGLDGVRTVLGNLGYGLYLLNDASNNEIAHNEITRSGQHGIQIEAQVVGQSVRNQLDLNKIHHNAGLGIRLNGGNQNLPAPELTGVDTQKFPGQWLITGRACIGCTINLFQDNEDEGEAFVLELAVDDNGRFTHTIPALAADRNLTALAFDSEGNTSGFSQAVGERWGELTGDALELTQAIQSIGDALNPFAEVPLVAGKGTVVRAHVRSARMTRTNVFARLNAFRDGQQLAPANLLAAPNDTLMVPNPDRTTLRHSFDFRIPEAWTHGRVRFVFELDPLGSIHENNRVNNTLVKEVIFHERAPVCLVVYSILTEMGAVAPDDPAIVDMIRMAEERFPTAEFRIFPRGILREDGSNFEMRQDKSKVLSILTSRFISDFREGNLPPDCGDLSQIKYHGIIRMGSNVPSAGLAYRSGVAGWSVMSTNMHPQGYISPTGGSVLAHEVAHNFGRKHVDCGDPDGTDGRYPYDPCHIGPAHPLGYYGYSLRSSEVIVPTAAGDLMSYRWPNWISDYTYRALFDRLAVEGNAAAAVSTGLTADEHAALLISGIITTATQSATLSPLLPFAADSKGRTLSNTTQPATAQTAAYKLILRDRSGKLIVEHPFTPEETDHEDGAHVGDHQEQLAEEVAQAFALLVTLPTGRSTNEVAEVVLVQLAGSDSAKSETELLAKKASSQVPTIQLLTPNGGDQVDKTLTVSWQANDADGDPLAFSVFYSPDGGHRWQLLAQEISGNSLTVETDHLAGAVGQALVRVVASDGMNSSRDESDNGFSVARHAPRPMIDGHRGSYATGEAVLLTGRAFDTEDGFLPATAFAWSSDLDGKLEGGRELFTAALSEGIHTVTLTVTDRDGQKGETTTSVVVGEAEEPLSQPQPQIFLPVVYR